MNPTSPRDDNDNDSEDLFATSEHYDRMTTKDGNNRPTKRARHSSGTTSGEAANKDPSLLEHAKKRLSKWAARLFDPDRPRGLVQPPEIIPLNDEFLTAFGKREKIFDKAQGKELAVDTQIRDEDEQDQQTVQEQQQQGTANTANNGKKNGFKVKVANLGYRTTERQLRQACERFGAVWDVKMPMSKDDPNLNAGRAYVTFEHVSEAEDCMENFRTLQGRSLRVSMAGDPKSDTNGFGKSANTTATTDTHQSLLNRFWVEGSTDISTTCFRCGKVGHMESDCPNQAKVRPCNLCGETTHEIRSCPNRQICFNCGIPGHVSRDCTARRGMPRRMVCGTCFQDGHHRMSCRSSGYLNPPDAICMSCGERGHFLCEDLKWFYGLRDTSCFNCGEQGHSGFHCRRPNLNQCQQNPQIAQQEIDRASAQSISESLAQPDRRQQERHSSRGRQEERESAGRSGSMNNSRGYHSSMPTPRGGKLERRGYQY